MISSSAFLLLEQSRADTATVFLLDYKTLGVIVILGKHLQIVAARAKVFVSFPAYVVDIGDRRFGARLRRLSSTQRGVVVVRSFGSGQVTVGIVRLSAVSTW